MLIDLRRVTPGELPNEVFNVMVSDDRFSPEMVEALRDHFVNGLTVPEAYGKHEKVAPNKFRIRVKSFDEQLRKYGEVFAILNPLALEAALQLSQLLNEKLNASKQKAADQQ